MNFVILIGITVASELCLTSAQPAEDEVKSLPGLTSPHLSSKQYSGYLSASGTIKLHYWFVESERDPKNDPLVLWMNGGPGCSSLDGYLSELGPYLIDPDGVTLTPNKYSWSKVANVIFLEAPAGVGFSYSADKNYTTGDNETAQNNYLALLDFFVKFPNMADKPFFITGESYGGIYVPTLAFKVMKNASINFQGPSLHAWSNTECPLTQAQTLQSLQQTWMYMYHGKGFAIGNGLLDVSLNTDTMIYYAYNHAIIGEDLWSKLQQYCCQNDKCNFVSPPNLQCLQALSVAVHSMFSIGINPYDVTGDCAGGVPDHDSLQSHLVFVSHYFELTFIKPINKTKSQPSDNILACIDTGPERRYLNDPDVRKILHIPDHVPEWKVCNMFLNANYKREYQSVQELFNILLPKHRGLIYNGDADMMCNFLGDQKFAASLSRKELTERRPWTYNNQIAGFVHEYDQVTFMTVKNAGHMVPTFTPGAALQMITNFLKNQPQ